MTDAAAVAPKRFRPYSKYKRSGMEWLEKVPEGWEIKRLRFVVKTNPVKSEVQNLPPDTLVSFVPMEAIGELGGLVLDSTKPLDSVSQGYTYFRNGDVVVAKITPCFENGKGALAFNLENGIAFGTTELHVLRSLNSMDSHFLFYLTISEHFRCIGASEMFGAGGQKRISEDFVRNFKHPLPEVTLQRTIAAFLDRETAKIDALTAKKERLIALLQEQRSALITRAVTKGLDPKVAMKDSGVEWLGKVPEGWGIKKIKWSVSKIGSGKTPSGGAEVYADEGIMLLRSQNIHFYQLMLDDVAFISDLIDAGMSGSRVIENDVLLNITGASIGRCCVARLKGKKANVNQHVCVLRPCPKVLDSAYLSFFLGSETGQYQISNSEDGISREALNFVQVANLIIPLPPLAEQQTIAAFLDRETAKIDALIAKVRDGIERLKEYRSALISAAVTGKIDLRGEAAGRLNYQKIGN